MKKMEEAKKLEDVVKPKENPPTQETILDEAMKAMRKASARRVVEVEVVTGVEELKEFVKDIFAREDGGLHDVKPFQTRGGFVEYLIIWNHEEVE